MGNDDDLQARISNANGTLVALITQRQPVLPPAASGQGRKRTLPGLRYHAVALAAAALTSSMRSDRFALQPLLQYTEHSGLLGLERMHTSRSVFSVRRLSARTIVPSR